MAKFETDRVKFEKLLRKYSDQLKTATGILQKILVKGDKNTLYFDSDRSYWNNIVHKMMENVEPLSTEIFGEVKTDKVRSLESQFSEIMNFFIVKEI